MAATTLELNFDRRLEVVTAGLPGEFSGLLQNKISREDALIVMDFHNLGKNFSYFWNRMFIRFFESLQDQVDIVTEYDDTTISIRLKEK